MDDKAAEYSERTERPSRLESEFQSTSIILGLKRHFTTSRAQVGSISELFEGISIALKIHQNCS